MCFYINVIHFESGSSLRKLGSLLTFGLIRQHEAAASASLPHHGQAEACPVHGDGAFGESHAQMHGEHSPAPHVLHGLLVLG